MNLPREQIHRRFAEFPDPVRLLGYDNAVVRRIVDMFAQGEIITLQEALCKMIVALANESDSHKQSIVDLMRRSTFPSNYVPEPK